MHDIAQTSDAGDVSSDESDGSVIPISQKQVSNTSKHKNLNTVKKLVRWLPYTKGIYKAWRYFHTGKLGTKDNPIKRIWASFNDLTEGTVVSHEKKLYQFMDGNSFMSRKTLRKVMHENLCKMQED